MSTKTYTVIGIHDNGEGNRFAESYEDINPGGARIAIYDTSAGFVSPSVGCFAYAASNFDGDIERAIAEKAQGEALPAGIYIARWQSEHGVSEYVFTVRVETHTTHHVEVAP